MTIHDSVLGGPLSVWEGERIGNNNAGQQHSKDRPRPG